jgi:hypothetical protein
VTGENLDKCTRTRLLYEAEKTGSGKKKRDSKGYFAKRYKRREH